MSRKGNEIASDSDQAAIEDEKSEGESKKSRPGLTKIESLKKIQQFARKRHARKLAVAEQHWKV